MGLELIIGEPALRKAVRLRASPHLASPRVSASV